MKLSEFGRELEKQFGWDFARLTTPTSSWDRVKKALGTVFKALHKDWLWKGIAPALQRGETIEDTVRNILLSNRGIQPDDMVAKLKLLRYSEEEINKSLGPRGKP